MEYFCGNDIIEVARIKEAILNTKGFIEKIYTNKEIEVGNKKSEKVRYEYFAGRFAAKEAIYKAVSAFKNDFNFWEVEILNDKDSKNRPIVKFKIADLLTMQSDGILQIDVSISHIADYAMATAIAKVNKP